MNYDFFFANIIFFGEFANYLSLFYKKVVYLRIIYSLIN